MAPADEFNSQFQPQSQTPQQYTQYTAQTTQQTQQPQQQQNYADLKVHLLHKSSAAKSGWQLVENDDNIRVAPKTGKWLRLHILSKYPFDMGNSSVTLVYPNNSSTAASTINGPNNGVSEFSVELSQFYKHRILFVGNIDLKLFRLAKCVRFQIQITHPDGGGNALKMPNFVFS